MRKIILTTLFSGYNYGSSLQALAGKILMKELGYNCDLVAMKSWVKGRDVRLSKLIVILWRSFMLSSKGGIKAYMRSYKKEMIGDSKVLFNRFQDQYLQPYYMTWRELKNKARECTACIAGSDQIWNSSTMYVDPLYYLRFASKEKRIALAPSFGRDFIADYNRAKMRRWISEFAHISVREDSGVELIKEMTGRDAMHLVDPTLMIDGEIWRNTLGIKKYESNYVLAYFLDVPSDTARRAINDIKEHLGSQVIAIPYSFENLCYWDQMIPTGPKEFVELVANARCVLTDSFHGTAFSINLHTPFFVFERAYGTSHSQNSRLESLLRKMRMEPRFEPKDVNSEFSNIDFEYSDKVLNAERINAREYLLRALNQK